MEFLKDVVYRKPVFEKIAEYELPKSITEWNEEILKNFFEEVESIPHDAGVDVVINNIEENEGYAKGSIVVFYKNKKINFPIIVKDYKLKPFDVFVAESNGKQTFFNASAVNIQAHLMSDKIGEPKNMYDYVIGRDIKTPGGIAPKPSIAIDQAAHDLTIQDQMSFRKMSCLKKASIADLEKVAIQLEAEPDVMQSFVETTGDLKAQIVDAIQDKREVSKEKQEGKLDINSVVKAKQMTVALDSELFDVNNMVPVKPSSVCELRLYEYPSMSDFMQSGQSMVSRLDATKVGKPVTGVVLAYKEISEYDNCYPCAVSPVDGDNTKREMRESVDQIFISADGLMYRDKRDYDKTGVLFYGSKTYNTPGIMAKVIENIADNNINDFQSFDNTNHGTGADKVFNPIAMADQSAKGNGNKSPIMDTYGNKSILILYGAGEFWECAKVNNISKVWTVEGRKVYMSNSIAIIPSNVASIQKVGSVDVLTEPLYKMILGKIKNIYLVPESSVVISTRLMTNLDDVDIMSPSKSVKAMWDERALNKVAVYVGEEGYKIDGAPVEALKKLASFNELGAKDALNALRIMGVDKDRGTGILKQALLGPVTVYGVSDDYINENVFEPMEKKARKKEIFRKMADILRTDTVKIASAIEDPEAVDNVLSLNFINEDNLTDYVGEIPNMKKSVTKLAGMLVASRMGLADIDEGATKKAIDGLEKVIDGLESVKMAMGSNK